MALSVAYTGKGSSTTAGTVQTMASVPMGTASADRHVVVAVTFRGSVTISSCSVTIGGTAVTQKAFAGYTGVGSGVWIGWAKIASGTSGTVAATFNASVARSDVSVHAVTGASDIELVDSSASASCDSFSQTLTTQAGGALIAKWFHGAPAEPEWTGCPADYYLSYNSYGKGAAGSCVTSSASRAVSLYWGNPGSNAGAVGVVSIRETGSSASSYTYAQTVVRAKPRVYYRLGESSGTTAADSSGNGNTGTYTATGVTYGAPGMVGDSDTAVTFNGSSGRVSGPSWSTLGMFFGTGITFECSFSTTADLAAIACFSDPTARDVLIRPSSSTGAVEVYTGNFSAPTIGTTDVTDGAERMLHVVIGASGVKIYLDGVEESYAATGVNTTVESFATLSVGGRPATSEFLAATVDDFALYGYRLSSTQIAQAVALTAGVVPSGSASGAFQWSGAASGKRTPKGSAAGSFQWSGAAVGKRTPKGSTAGSFQWVGAAAGITPSGSQGSASGAFQWSGAASGRRDPKATANGSFQWSGAAVGAADYSGTAAGSFTWSGVAVGSSSPGVAADLSAPVLTSASLVSWDSQAVIPEADVLSAPVETSARLRSPLILATPPEGVHDVERHAHLMPELTEAAPRRKGVVGFAGTDDYLYRVERSTAGRAHVFVNGRDVTFTRGKGALVRDRSSSIPVGPVSASVQFPQFQPWDRTGEGDWAWCDLDRDPQVDIVWRHDDGTEEHVWEGFGASEGDGSPGLLVNCEGLFAQAQHAPWDPPVFMDERDIGHVIADALNGVKHRRWNKIPRVTTGITTSDRGRQGESVWQYVQDLLSLAFTSSGRQWTLARVAPYTYRIQLKKAMTVVDWTVTYQAPGVNVSLTRDQSVRRDAIYGRGYAKDGGYWCGRVFPGLEFGVPPQYPMTNTSLTLAGRTDATTDTGNGITVWQRKMRDLGYSITVDGSMDSVDTEFVRQVQRARGILVDGVLGPQTWAATWENNSTDADTTSYRLPLAAKTEVMPWLYSASGAKVGRNPANDPSIIAHENPEVAFPEGTSKERAKVIAELMLDLEADPPWTGTIVLDTDPWEPGSSRFLIREGDNVDVLGHPAGTVQVSEVSQSGGTVTLHVATRAMDRLTLAAIRERNVTARRDASSRAYTLNESSLNKASVVQYESESRAGTVPRTAVNGDVGLWTIRKTFVSQVGVAKVEFDATSPKAELVVALFNRPIRTTVLASLVADPLADSDGWYDNIETLQAKYGLMEVYGGPGNPGGYWPRQKDAGPLTGKLRESGALPYSSPYGGFVWVAMFTSRSCWVEGRVFPAVPT